MTIDLKPFCYTGTSIAYISFQNPWTRDGFTYATDGRILLRLPARPDVPDNPHAPDINQFPFDHANLDPSLWLPIPTPLPQPRSVTCKFCGGKGLIVINRGGNNDGDTCPECDGGGSWQQPNGVPFGHQTVSEIYLALILKELPSPFLAPNAVEIGSAIPLKFGRHGAPPEGVGYLMPMRASN